MVPIIKQGACLLCQLDNCLEDTPPQNFSRHPAWWCYLMAPMYGSPLQHIVDDVMATERCSFVDSGNHVWMKTTAISGGKLPTPNHHCLQVIHVYLKLMSGTASTAPSWILPGRDLVHSNNFCSTIWMMVNMTTTISAKQTN